MHAYTCNCDRCRHDFLEAMARLGIASPLLLGRIFEAAIQTVRAHVAER